VEKNALYRCLDKVLEKPPTKNVTVTGFCVTSSGALPNLASNSLRLIQALGNRR
jgi:hypothetical protein